MSSAASQRKTPANLDAALALLAFGLCGLSVAILWLSDQWLSPDAWVWLASGVAYGGGATAAFILLRLRRPRWLALRAPGIGAPPELPGSAPRRVVAGLRDALAAAPLRSAVALLGMATAFAAVAVLHGLGDDRPARDYGAVLALWLGAIALFAFGVLSPARPPSRQDIRRWWAHHRQPLADAAALTALALVLRGLMLVEVPSITTGDEGVFGNAARWMSEGEGGHMFGTYWANGTAYLLPHALLLRWGMEPALAIRLPTALLAALAAPGTYFLGRLFDRRVGLVAGLLVASSHLHLHVSRMGLGHGMDAAWAALALWGLVGGILRRNRRMALLGGLALGAAQHGYVGGRLIDLVALVVVLLFIAGAAIGGGGPAAEPAMARLRTAVRRVAMPVAVAGTAALAVALPMVRWALVRPEDYMSRLQASGALQSGVVAEQLTQSASWAVGLRRLSDGVLAYVAAPADQFYFTPFAMLDVTWSALFMVGGVIAVARMRDPRLLAMALHVIGGAVVLALSTHSATSGYRISGVLPSVAVLAAVALWLLVEGALQDAGRGWVRGVAVTVTVSIVAFNVWAYFGHFAPGCRFFDDNTARASLIGRHAGSLNPDSLVFVYGEPTFHPEAYESVEYLSGRRVKRMAAIQGDEPQPGQPGSRHWTYSVPRALLPGETAKPLRAIGDQPVAVYVTPDREQELAEIRALLPEGRSETLRRCGETLVHSWVRR